MDSSTQGGPMSEQPHPSQEALPPSVFKRLDKICDCFEAVWKMAESTGQRPRIEDYLGDTPEPERSALVRELVVLDIDYRRQAGENPTTEEYRAFYAGKVFTQPDMAITVSARTAMEADVVPAASDSEMSRSAQVAAPFAPGPTRIRCPHCQNPIQLSDHRPDEVLCPACG